MAADEGLSRAAGAATHGSLDQLEFVHRTAGLTSWIWDVPRDRVEWFGDADALLGLPRGQFSGRFDEYLARLHPEDVPSARRTYVECLKGRRQAYRSEERLLWPDGSVRWLETFGRAEHAADGRAMRMAGVVRDITKRRAAEQRILELNSSLEARVRSRTAELEAANRDLEEFGLAVSHDLRAPAITIASFAELLECECGDELSAAGLQHLAHIHRVARRMGSMIDGLLDLSRAGRTDLAMAPVSLREIAEEVVEDLRPAYRFTGEVRLGELPGACGDARLLRQVLQNLVANAMKFTRQVREPAIVLEGRRIDARRVEYCVRDNGCGFDSRHAARLFAAFQRLHPERHYEGVGVGLATVRRIVERHGGTVRAEGEAGAGAAFYFTLKAAAVSPSSGGA